MSSELMFIPGKTNKSSELKLSALSQMASSTKWLKSHISTFASVCTMALSFSYAMSFHIIIWIIPKEDAGGAEGWRLEEDFYRWWFGFLTRQIFSIGTLVINKPNNWRRLSHGFLESAALSATKKSIPSRHNSCVNSDIRSFVKILEIRCT